MTVQTLTPQLAEEFGLNEEASGVVITEVIANSPAADNGLQPGDVIKRLGQKRVATSEELEAGIEAAREAGRSGVLMLIESENRTRFVQLGFIDR